MLPGKILNLLFMITAAIYIAATPFKPYFFAPLLKILPLCVLLAATYGQLSGRTRLWGFLAVLLCACGDVLLALTIPDSFIFGLGLFLLGHILYLVAFSQYANRRFFLAKVTLSTVVVLSAFTLSSMLLPATNALAIPVAAYICIITAMVVVAVFAWSQSIQHLIGAFMFLVSDTILAWNMFLSPVPFADYTIMLTYYTAQLFLVAGLIKLFTDRQIHSSL